MNAYESAATVVERPPEQRRMIMYVKPYNSRCWRARRLLQRRGYAFEEIEVFRGIDYLDLSASSKVVPQLFIDGRPVGGLSTIKALDRSGDLERLVRGDV
jgi:glutaredoxin 3